MPVKSIASFMTGTYTLAKESGGAYDANGYWIAGTSATTNIDACIQPLSGYDLKNLPEGKHSENTRRVYTTSQIDGVQVNQGDILTIDSEPWQVWRVERWEGLGTVHYKALVTRQVVP